MAEVTPAAPENKRNCYLSAGFPANNLQNNKKIDTVKI